MTELGLINPSSPPEASKHSSEKFTENDLEPRLCCCCFRSSKGIRCKGTARKFWRSLCCFCCFRISKSNKIVGRTEEPVRIKATLSPQPRVVVAPPVVETLSVPKRSAPAVTMSFESRRIASPRPFSGNGSHSISRMSSSVTLPGKNVHRVSSLSSSQILSRGHGYSNSASSAPGYKLHLVAETATFLKRKFLTELGALIAQDYIDTSFIQFIEWIRSERLSSLPHKGSRWDRVLIRAQYFAESLNSFETAIKSFAIDSAVAAEIGYGSARLLLSLGHENSEALDKIFAFFYKQSLQISALVARSELLAVTSQTREELSVLFADLLTLVADVAIRLHKIVHGQLSSHTSIDLYEVFGETIQTLSSRCENITQDIWTYQISQEGFEPEDSIQVDVLRRWLAPQDHVVEALSRDHTTFADQAAEFTCLWFQKHLSRFIQDKGTVLSVTGPSGSGKTVLGASIADRLQRPVAKKTFSVLFSSISSGIPSQAKSINVVKSLLYQLVNLRIGNIYLYNALVNAYNQSRASIDAASYEKYLWDALGEALSNPLDNSQEIVLVVDGLDEVHGGRTVAQDLFKKLIHLADHGKGVKLITLSQGLEFPANHSGSTVEITPDDASDDIREVALRDFTRDSKHFRSQDGGEQEEILEKVRALSNGSFVWATLCTDLLELKTGSEYFTKTLAEIENPKSSLLTVQALVQRHLTGLELEPNAKTLLAWLLVAERPFTFLELRTLFSIDPKNGVIKESGIDIQKLVHSIHPFVTVHEDVVRIRHNLIRESLQTLGKSTFTLPIKDAQNDLLLRTLTYTKIVLKDDKREPTFDDFDHDLANRLFQKHRFLEYSVRYWTNHLKQSPVYDGQFHLTEGLKKVFPSSVALPILEWLCWEAELSTFEALELHILVSRLRHEVEPKSLPLLQSYIIISTYHTLFDKSTDAAKYYYLSTRLSTIVLSPTHHLTIYLADKFLTITQTWKFESRTEIATYKIEIFKILIESYTSQSQYGSTSQEVIELKSRLAKFYESIKEVEEAKKIFIELDKVAQEEHGLGSDEHRRVRQQITVRSHQHEHQDEGVIDLFHEEDTREEVEVLDVTQVEVVLRQIEAFVAKQDFYNAESTYINLWQQVTSKSRTSRSIEWHQKNIQVAQLYASYLISQKRTTESTYILTSIWQAYSDKQELISSLEIAEEFTKVAKLLKTLNQHTTALSIFKYVSTYYKSVKKHESKSFTEIEEEIASTSTEVVKQSFSSTSTVTESSGTVSQSTFKSVFHSMITNSSKTVDKTTMTLAKSIAKSSIEQHQYSEAISIVQSTYSRTWTAFLSESVQAVTLTSTFQEENIELAQILAESYLKLRQFEKVEGVYIRLFQAVLTSKKPGDALFEKVKALIISFYDRQGSTSKTISVYQELLVVYKRTLGPNHKDTVRILYELGSRCRKHARDHPYWIDYYVQIIDILNKDSSVSHIDAIDALIIVATTYWEDRRYAEAVTVYAVLFNTFVQKHKEIKHFSETHFVKELYQRYFQSLEETRVELDVLYKVASQYRSTVKSVFGASSTISVEATLSLAEVSQRSEKYSAEAISLFEEITKTNSSSISVTRITQIKEQLSVLYKREITSKKSTSISSESIARATSIYSEQLSEYKSKYGYSHSTTLTTMRELLQLYQRQQKTELIIKELHTATTELLLKETNSQKLIESAAYIAETFSVCHLETECRQLIEELTVQIVAGYQTNKTKFSLNVTTAKRTALVFIASLEYQLRTDLNVTFSEIMANLVYAAFHFDHYKGLVRSNAALDKIVIAGAPLWGFLQRKGAAQLLHTVEEEVIQLFIRRDTAKLKLKSPQASPRHFIVAVLEHLSHPSNNNFVWSIIQASNINVLKLTQSGKFNEAHDVGYCAFLFAQHMKGYTAPNAISQGFKLALLLAGRDGAKRCPEPGLHKDMLKLSNEIVVQILKICKEKNINFARVELDDLNQLAGLLGEQGDYDQLEKLLSSLWTTREAQREWPAYVLLNLGRRLIMARYLAGENLRVKAVRLCEDIAYNLRRSYGARHPATLETYQLLSQLYTSVGKQYAAKPGKGDQSLATQYFRKALLLHEDLLKSLVYEGTLDDENDDELDSTAAILSQHGVSVSGSAVNGGGSEDGLKHDLEISENFDQNTFVRDNFRLLKYSYQRLGKFPKQDREYSKLNTDLYAKFGDALKGTEGVEKWTVKGFGQGKAESEEGAFKAPQKWEFAEGANLKQIIAQAV